MLVTIKEFLMLDLLLLITLSFITSSWHSSTLFVL